MTFDVASVRSSFPALSDGTAYFDNPGGTQVPRQVAAAVADTLCAGVSNRGTITAAERRADAVVTQARTAVADLLGCDAGGVIFGRSMTTLTYDMARALAKTWGPGDEVVVTRLDHDANIRPWVTAAQGAGATVRWVDFDQKSTELPVAAVESQLSARTKLLAVTGASNLFGTRPDIPAITAAAHRAGALAYVDGVHLTAHSPVDVFELGADFYACSPYKFFGPHHGVLVATPDLLASVHPDKLLPSTNLVPERFEMGTLPYELLAGTAAAIDFLAGMASTAADRRSRVLESMGAAEAYEQQLCDRLLQGLARIDAVTLHGFPAHRTPTAVFSVAGHPPSHVHSYLAERGVNAPAGSFYAIEAARWSGLGDAGVVRAGIAPYTNADDVDRLVDGVWELTR